MALVVCGTGPTTGAALIDHQLKVLYQVNTPSYQPTNRILVIDPFLARKLLVHSLKRVGEKYGLEEEFELVGADQEQGFARRGFYHVNSSDCAVYLFQGLPLFLNRSGTPFKNQAFQFYRLLDVIDVRGRTEASSQEHDFSQSHPRSQTPPQIQQLPPIRRDEPGGIRGWTETQRGWQSKMVRSIPDPDSCRTRTRIQSQQCSWI